MSVPPPFIGAIFTSSPNANTSSCLTLVSAAITRISSGRVVWLMLSTSATVLACSSWLMDPLMSRMTAISPTRVECRDGRNTWLMRRLRRAQVSSSWLVRVM